MGIIKDDEEKSPCLNISVGTGKKQASSQLPIGSTKWIDPEVETCLGHESNTHFTETTTIAFPLGFVSSRPDMDHLGYALYYLDLHKLNKLVETEGTTAKIGTILEHWDR